MGMGRDERDSLSDAGGSERRSHVRMAGDGSQISHSDFRAAVWQRACRASGGKKPSTAALFKANKEVRKALARSGVRVCTPGAQPGRVTR